MGAVPTRLWGSCYGGGERMKADPGAPAGKDQDGPTRRCLPARLGGPGAHTASVSGSRSGPGCLLVSGSLPGTPDPRRASSGFASPCSLALAGGCPGGPALSHSLAELLSQASPEDLEVQPSLRVDPQEKNPAVGTDTVLIYLRTLKPAARAASHKLFFFSSFFFKIKFKLITLLHSALSQGAHSVCVCVCV